MDETIGAKGGHNDRLRSLRISKAQKKKLKEHNYEYIKQLEKKVRKQQRYTLIKTIPIIIAGTVVHNFFGMEEETKNNDESVRHTEQKGIDEKASKGEIKQRKLITLPTGEKVVVYIPLKKDKKLVEEPKEIPNDTLIEPQELPQKQSSTTQTLDQKPKEKTPSPAGIGELQEINDILLDGIESDIKFKDADFNELNGESKEQLSKLRSKKIIEYYEEKLKDIRYDLRQTIYEYNVLVKDDDEVIISDDAKVILDRLTELISKIEELRRKIDVENIDKYDDNYIYVLIEEYISDFRDKKVIKEIKDSPLYIMISSKLDELEEKREKYSKKIEQEQIELSVKEKDFEELKKNYYSIEKINEELSEFQKDQERLLKSLKEKVANSTSTYERVEYELNAMAQSTRRIMRLLLLQMFLPGAKFAKSFATSTAAYLYFLKNVYNPNVVEKKYRVIQVTDYSNEIENSISAIDDASELLGKTYSQIDKVLSQISDKYKDYIGVIPECDRIISSLKKIKQDVEEKEYEMKRLKKQQELVLEENKAKVLTIGEYPVK